jgi:hypothetical protein
MLLSRIADALDGGLEQWDENMAGLFSRDV